MRIKALNIERYGKFSGRTFEFGEKINLICGGNESGKSTILSFMFFMLYGPSGNSYEKDGAAGSMTVLMDGVEYLIERSYDELHDVCSVTDAASGRRCFEGQQPGAALLGFSSDAFKSACFVGQQSGELINDRLIAGFAEKLALSGSERADIGRILSVIKSAEAESDRAYCERISSEYGADDYAALENMRKRLGHELEDRSARERRYLELDGKLAETEKNLSDNIKRKAFLEKQTEAYAAHLKKKRFRQIMSLQEKYKECDDARRRFREEHSKNGFFPDDGYLNNLGDLSDRIKHCDSEIDGITNRLNRDGGQGADRRVPSDRGGRVSEIGYGNLKRYESAAERPKKSGLLFSFGMLLLFLTAAAIGFTFFFFSVKKLFGIISAVGTVFLALGALAAIAVSSGFKIGGKTAGRKDEYDYSDGEYLDPDELYSKNGAYSDGTERTGGAVYSDGAVYPDETAYSNGKPRRNGETNPNGAIYNDLEYPEYTSHSGSAYDGLTYEERRERLVSEREQLEVKRSELSMHLCEQYSRWGESLDEVLEDVPRLLEEYRPLDEKAETVAAELELAKKQYAALEGADLRDDAEYDRLSPDFDIQKAIREYGFVQKACESLEKLRDELQSRLTAAVSNLSDFSGKTEEIGANDPAKEYKALYGESQAEDFERLYAMSACLEDGKCASDSYKLAYLAVFEAGDELKRRLSPKVFGLAGKYLDALTGGRFCRAAVSNGGDIVLVSPEGKEKSIRELGGGLSDLTYLSLRMALLSAAISDGTGKNAFPFMLDGYLSRLDKEHLESALVCIGTFAESGAQVFLTSSDEKAIPKLPIGIDILRLTSGGTVAF